MGREKREKKKDFKAVENATQSVTLPPKKNEEENEKSKIEKEQPLLIEKSVNQFMESIDSLRLLSENATPFVSLLARRSFKELLELIKQKNLKTESLKDKENGFSVTISAEHYHSFTQRIKKIRNIQAANEIAFKSYLIALIASFDALVSSLVEYVFFVQPEKCKECQKEFKLSDLLDYEIESKEDIKALIVTEEVESLGRESHIKQFNKLEKIIGVQLSKELSSWPKFIEITERRNLYAHCNGAVSRQYLKNTSQVRYFVGKTPPFKGEILPISSIYFIEACDCIYEIGVKLAHVFWRVLHQKDKEKIVRANIHLMNDVSFNLICAKRYSLAIKMIEFTLRECERDLNERDKLSSKLNLAQCYKWNGDMEKCKEILDEEDWNSKNDLLCMANLILRGKFKEAARVMEKVKKRDGDGPESYSIEKNYYFDWPIFQEFIKSAEFASAYQSIYGEEPTQTEEMPSRPEHHSIKTITESDK